MRRLAQLVASILLVVPISSAQNVVTSVTGVFPIASSGGSTPAISLQSVAGTNVNTAYGAGNTAYWTGSGGAATRFDIPCGDAQGGFADCIAFQILTSTYTLQVNLSTASDTYQGGQDTTDTAGSTLGSATVRGADVICTTGCSTVGTQAGSTNIRGGDNSEPYNGTGTVFIHAGSLNLRPGAVTTATGAQDNTIPGYLSIAQTYRLGSPYTVSSVAGNLGCITGHNTISDCGSASLNPEFVGIHLPLIGSQGAVDQIEGVVGVYSATQQRWNFGDVICTDPNNAAVAVDNGKAACPCPQTQVGIASIEDTAMGTFNHVITIARNGCVPVFGAVNHEWINSISVGGVPSASQPAASDLSNGTTGSGSVVLSASPALTGTTTAANLTVTGTCSGCSTTYTTIPFGQSSSVSWTSGTNYYLTGVTQILNTVSTLGTPALFCSTIYGLSVGTSPAVPSVDTYTFTVHDGTTSSNLTSSCQIAGGNSTCSDTVHTPAWTAGDVMNVNAVCTGTCGSFQPAVSVVIYCR